jgi:hypothetical protein
MRQRLAIRNSVPQWPAIQNSPAVHAREGWSGRRGSNPRPTAWKAVTLPLSYSRLRVLPALLLDASARQARCARSDSPPLNSTVVRSVGSPSRSLLRRAPESGARQRQAKAGGEGRTRTFEAARATDLQSAAFDRFATSPTVCYWKLALFLDACLLTRWSWRRDLNPRPADYKSAALPSELRQRKQKMNFSTSCATCATPCASLDIQLQLSLVAGPATLYSTHFRLRCLTASNSATPAATDTFRL